MRRPSPSKLIISPSENLGFGAPAGDAEPSRVGPSRFETADMDRRGVRAGSSLFSS